MPPRRLGSWCWNCIKGLLCDLCGRSPLTLFEIFVWAKTSRENLEGSKPLNPRMKRILILTLLVLAHWTAKAQEQTTPSASSPAIETGTFSQDQIRALIRQVAEKDMENDKKQHDYTYVQRVEEHRLNGKGEVQKTEVRTSEIMMLYGDQIERLIAKDDKPLSEKDAAKEEERIQKLADKRKNESDKD